MKIQINKECLILKEIVLDRKMKEGETVFVVDAFLENSSVFFGIKSPTNGRIVEIGFKGDYVIKNTAELEAFTEMFFLPTMGVDEMTVIKNDGIYEWKRNIGILRARR